MSNPTKTALLVELKEKITKKIENKETLGFIEAYNKTIEAIPNNKSQDAKTLILRIGAKYALMNSLLGIYDIFNDAFLSSSLRRRAMLSDGGALIFYKDNELNFFALEDYISDQDTLVNIAADNNENPTLTLWQGCEMTMPEKCEIILSFSQVYPSLFIKRKGTDNEIFIEEYPWNVNYVANSDLLIKEGKSGDYLKSGNLNMNEVRHSGSISKKQLLDDDFKEFSIELKEALEKYNVVIQMPYITPRADMLLKVSFDNKKPENEIILTTS